MAEWWTGQSLKERHEQGQLHSVEFLKQLLDLLRDRVEVAERGVTIPDYPELGEFITAPGYPLSDNSKHVFFIGIDNHVHELFIAGAGWLDNDLTALT